MARRLAAITLDNLGDVAEGPRRCLFWELGPGMDRDDDPEQVKEAWVSSVLLEWGPCGTLVYVDGAAAGHVFYAPAAMVPRSTSFGDRLCRSASQRSSLLRGITLAIAGGTPVWGAR